MICLDGDTGEVVAELIYGTPTKTVPAKLWSDPTSDPLADIRGALRLVSSSDVELRPTSSSWARTRPMPSRATRTCSNAYDKLRIAPGELAPATIGWGVQSLGTYRGIPLYVYEAEYLNSAGAMTPYVPPDNVLVAASSLGGTMAYAGIAQVDAARAASASTPAEECRSWPSRPWKTTGNSGLSSRPVPVPKTWQPGRLLDVL